MLYYLDGNISEYTPETVIVDCGGVGFEVNITPSTAAALTIGEKRRIYLTESIGESNFDLYGFLSADEKRYFKLLTSVSGIGPKAAMSILSYNSPEALAKAIINDNETAFTSCPGIGKKIAQRIILELKDKISKTATFTSFQDVISPTAMKVNTAYDEAVSALSALGYSPSDFIPIMKQIDIDGKRAEEIIRNVLKFMI